MKKISIISFVIILTTFISSIMLNTIVNKKLIKEDTISLKNKSVLLAKTITKKNLKFKFDKKVLIKDVIKGNVKGKVPTNKLGKQKLTVKYKNNKYVINYKVVDTKKPIILGGTTKTTTVGKKIDLVNKYLCGDNHDAKPKCYIEGKYDINKVGTYKLKYVAKDSSGNKTTKNIKLKVIEKKNSSSSSSSSTTTTVKRTKISTYIKKYKKKNTKIGIDVSAWQDDINWEKVKKDGVEFAMLRIGYGPSNNQIKLDKRFENNLKNAKKQKIPVGLYFYSYAKTKDEAKAQAKWIIKKLNGQKLDLPIAFDWENWNSFNKYNVSFKGLNDIAKTFISEVEKAGYKGMLYSSAYYLNIIWKKYENTWLAYYTSNNDFKKPYIMWQLSSKGKVNGINGSVDIDVIYKNKNKH